MEICATSSAAKPVLASMRSRPTSVVHQEVPTSPTEPSARSMTGRPSIMPEPMRSESAAATPFARQAMRSRNVMRLT